MEPLEIENLSRRTLTPSSASWLTDFLLLENKTGTDFPRVELTPTSSLLGGDTGAPGIPNSW